MMSLYSSTLLRRVFLRVVRKRRGSTVYEYAQITEHYRENGKQKNRVLEHLGPVHNQEDVDRYRKMFEKKLEIYNASAITPEDLAILPVMEFGTIYAAMHVMRSSGIYRSLSSMGKYRDTTALMIVSRIIEPSSDISLIGLSKRIYYPWWKISVSKDAIYRCLDAITKSKESIELAIFNTLRPDVSVVHYDLTSSYFEGREDNDLVLFGYSRDRKRGKEQIVVGLVMADGIPIYHELWPGNTVDPKTLESTVSVLKERFHVRNTVIVADRAFGRSPSLKLLDKNLYVTAVYRWDTPYRDILMHTEFTDSDKHGDLFIRTVDVNIEDITPDDAMKEEKELIGKRKYIAVYNPDREKSDIDDLNEKIDHVKMKMSEMSDPSDLKKSLGKLRSFVKFSNTVKMNEKRIAVLKALAGRFMIVTNTDLSIEDVVKSYKEQWMIERSFRTIKSFLDIRPVYHSKSERIRAHVFVAILSLLLSRLIEKKLNDETTISTAAAMLSEMKAVPVKFPSGTGVFRTESMEANTILKRLNIPVPNKILPGTLPEMD